jgi:hypothetical protein
LRTKLSTKAFELVGSRPSFARSQPKNVVISLAMTTIAVPVILPPNHRLLNRQQNNIDAADLTEQTTGLKDEYLLRTKHQQVRDNIGTQLGIFLDVQEESLVLEISRIFARFWCAHNKTRCRRSPTMTTIAIPAIKPLNYRLLFR